MQQSVIHVKHQKPGIYYILNTDVPRVIHQYITYTGNDSNEKEVIQQKPNVLVRDWMFSLASWSVHLQKCTKQTLSECCMWCKPTENNQTHHHIQTTSLIVNVQNSIQLQSGVFILHTLVTWCLLNYFYHTQWTRKVLFFWHCLWLFVFSWLCMIFWEPLNGFAPNSHRRRIGPSPRRDWMSRSKVKINRDKKQHFCPFGGRHAVCVW